MPDGPFKSMSREWGEPYLRYRDFVAVSSNAPHIKAEQCGKCGGAVFIGAWPFCSGKPEDHER